MRPEELLDLSPWGAPFRMIDRVVECVPHERIVALKAIQGRDMLALAHEPGAAVMPGLMVLECLNQAAALLFQATYGRLEPGRMPLLGHARARFPGSGATGETVTVSVQAVRMTPERGLFEGTARCADRMIAQAELAFAVGLEPDRPPGAAGGDRR